jgi:hypothetical protein
VVALMVPLAQAQAQPTGTQAAFGRDAGTLSDKFAGLARVLSGNYDWKPGQGILSVGDVFNLIVKQNVQAPVKLFGRDMTKQGALMLILEDQHEHLGQSIA